MLAGKEKSKLLVRDCFINKYKLLVVVPAA
jgi:hypothetical protein